MDISIGTIEYKVPRTRSGEFETELFERYQRNEQAFLYSMMEMVVNGLYTQSHQNRANCVARQSQVLCVRCNEAVGSEVKPSKS